jgi:hypothetical protein
VLIDRLSLPDRPEVLLIARPGVLIDRPGFDAG